MGNRKVGMQGLLVLFIFLALISFSSTVQAAEKQILVSYSAIEGGDVPLWVAQEAGIFPRYGLKTSLIYITSGSQSAQALLSGSVPLALIGGSMINANLAGADTVAIAGSDNLLEFVLMSQPSIHNGRELKGGAVAISRFGSLSDAAAREAVRKLGLTPDKDVTILQVGGTTARFAALKAGRVQAAMAVPPLNYEGEKLGFRTLVDLAARGTAFPMAMVGTTRTYIAKDPQTVMDFMKGFVAGIAYFKTHRQQGIQTIAKYFKLDDMSVVRKMYKQYAERVIPRTPYVSKKALENYIHFLAQKDSRARKLTAASVIDNSFVSKLDKSGFIDSLYKK